MINQREIAVYALLDITKDGGYNNIVLRKTLNKNNAMNAVEKAFVTELVNGCLRHLIYIDNALNYFSKTSTAKMKPFILNVLRIGAYQLLFMDKVPESAACNECVKLVKAKGFQNLAPFVNGVLRSVARKKNEIPLPDKEKTPVAYLSATYSYPEWLIDYWLLNMDFTTVEKMCAANNQKPQVTICVNTLKTDKQTLTRMLEAQGVAVTPCQWKENALFISHTSDFTSLAAFKEGLFHVMDQGAMLAVDLMGVSAGKTVLDMCAAPGGKSFYAGMLMRNAGKIFSIDIHEHKIKLIEESAQRLGVSIITAKQADAAVFNEQWEETADFVLVDAPCSGLGLVRKKPDIKYTKSMADVAALSQLQRDILAASHRYVKHGGILLYSTCTVSKAENEDNIEWFTKKYNFCTENIADLLPSMLQSKPTEKGQVQLLPNAYEGDGFFIAKLRRI